MRTSCLVALAWIITVAAANAAPDQVLFDFESGTWQGWTVEGGEFGPGPWNAELEAPQMREDRRPFGWQGKYMVRTGDTRHARTKDGRLVSDAFEITHDYLKFLFGGEVHPKVRVVLLVDGEMRRVVYGNNAYNLRLRGWDVQEFRGRKARLAIEEYADVDSLIRVDFFHLSNTPPPDLLNPPDPHPQEATVLRYGELKPVYSLPDKGIIRRSTLVRGPDHRWHLFGSWSTGLWTESTNMFHASADRIEGPYRTESTQALIAEAKQQEAWIRDPFVMVDDGMYYCFYVGSGVPWKGWDPANEWKKGIYGAKSTQGPYGIHLATSKDGNTWTRAKPGPLFTDAAFALTPYVLRVSNQWVMYYAGNEPASIKGYHAIIARTSSDLRDWNNRRPVFTRTATDFWPEHSFAHSPVVWPRKGSWYLLCGPIGNSNASRFHYRQLFRSQEPFHWDSVVEHSPLKGLFLEGGHCIVQDGDHWYVTHDGVYAGGVWLAPLKWND